MILFFVLLALAQSHLTTLLTEGSIFDAFRRWHVTKELFSCSLCIGFWTALLFTLLAGEDFFGLFVVAGLGHIITLARQKYLPCSTCSKPIIEEFKIR